VLAEAAVQVTHDDRGVGFFTVGGHLIQRKAYGGAISIPLIQ
jgi:hypothetical protein